MSANVGESYNEQILQSIIDGDQYINENPYPSRIEQLLMQLKTVIEQGGSVIIDTQVNGESTNPVQNMAIYNFVNSSVSTNTANFKGTYNSLAELQAVTDATNNDYGFVTGTDSAGNTYFDRYKYNGSEWVFEYELNNSSFTAAQWATIQSGLTAADKTKLDGIEAQANKTVVDSALSSTSTNPVQNKIVKDAIDGKQNSLSTAQLSAVNSGITAQDVNQITTNKTNIGDIQIDIGAPIINSSITLANYANALPRGYHTGFFTSSSKPSDAPVSDNCFVDFFIYSANTAIMRVYPTGTAFHDKIYYKTKVSGSWFSWYQFAGEQVQ